MFGLPNGLIEGFQAEMDGFRTDLTAIRALLEQLVKQGENK